MATKIPNVIESDSDLDTAVDWVVARKAEDAVRDAATDSVINAVKAYMEAKAITERRTDTSEVVVNIARDTISRTAGYDEEERREAIVKALGKTAAEELIVERVDEKALLKKLGKGATARAKYTEMGFTFRKGAHNYVFSALES